MNVKQDDIAALAQYYLRAYQILVVAVLWVGLFWLNNSVFSALNISEFVSWIFLPAALRMIAVLLLDWIAVAGLFVGVLITSSLLIDSSLIEMFPLAIISSYFPLLAKRVCTIRLGLTEDLAGISPLHLGVFALVGALFNAIPSQFYLYAIHRTEFPLNSLMPMIIGDVAGTMLVLYLASTILKFLSSQNWEND